MPADLSTDEARRRADVALAEWGCPRPDKHHYLTQQHAASGLARAARLHDDDPTGSTTNVYRCGCGGWVWGPTTNEGVTTT